MTRKTEKIEKGSKWNERKVKNIALLNLCLSAKGDRERRREREVGKERESREWVRAKSTDWLAPLQHSTASTAAGNKQMLQLLVLPLATHPHSHYPTLAATSSARGPCKDSSGIVPQWQRQRQHSFRATCHDDEVVASIFMLNLAALLLPTHWTCLTTCNAMQLHF